MHDQAQGLRNLPVSTGNATFATHDPEGIHRYVSKTSLHRLRAARPMAAMELVHWRFSLLDTHLDLVRLDCGSEFYIRKEPDTSHYVFQFPIEGVCELQSGRTQARAAPGQVFVLNPHQEAMKHWVGPCMQMMVQVDRRVLERVLAAELGRGCTEVLKFDQGIQDETVGRALSAMIRSMWQDLSENPVLQQWRVTRSLERNLLVAILNTLPHNYSSEFRQSALPAPYYIKRAEDYIRENVRNLIDIDQLVAVSGVSSRSLYYGFRRWRGTTPMTYLRNLRLSLAHEELKCARETGGNVTRVALGVGYDHLSRFSKDYRQRFGQSPSVTMLHGA